MAEDAFTASGGPDFRSELRSSVAVPDHGLLRVIGTGGYGEVWLAKNSLGAYRAIKIVREDRFRDKRPFERELNGVRKFEPLSRLHDGLVDILHVGHDEGNGYFYCVMELADDCRSGQAIDPNNYSPRTLAYGADQKKALPLAECLRIGITIASALEFLHERGLVHRDVKPSNIVFVNNVPKLADIGLVVEISGATSYVGTEGFIPPEGPGTARGDIYSLGKVLYEISTGKDRRDYPELPTRAEESLPGPDPAEFNKIILKACRSDPQQRYASSGEMMRDLQAVEKGKRIESERTTTGVLVKVMVMIAIVAMLAGFLFAHFRHSNAGELQSRVDKLGSSPGDSVPVTAPPGLVGCWRAEGDAIDSVSGIPALLLNGARISYEGKVGATFSLDGIDDHVRILDRPELRISGPITIETWVYPKTNGQWQYLLGKWDMVTGIDQRSFGLACFPRGRVYFAVSPGGLDAGTGQVISRTALPLNQWTHVAATYSGTNLSLYLNGILEDQTNYSSGIFPGTNDLSIGACVGGGTRGQLVRPFPGNIDELSIYNRSLTEAEIRTIFKAGSAGKRPPIPPVYPKSPAGLIGWWRAEGDAKDSARNHDGTLMNGASFAPGKIGQAFRFDGTNDFVKVPRADDLDVGKEVTIDFWMKADSDNFIDKCCQGLVFTEFYSVDISPGYTWLTGINFWVSTDDRATIVTTTSDTNNTAAIISVGEWHYVAGTYDGTGLQLYIDGQPWGKKTLHTGRISPMRPGSFLSIGSENGGVSFPDLVNSRYFKGLIDEVRVFNRCLSADEIAAIYKAFGGVSN